MEKQQQKQQPSRLLSLENQKQNKTSVSGQNEISPLINGLNTIRVFTVDGDLRQNDPLSK